MLDLFTTGLAIFALMHSPRPSSLFVLGSLLLGLGIAVPARAELVILVDGSVMKVSGYEANDDQALLQLATGGRMTLPIDRVDRVIEDEVIPEPEPPKSLVQEVAQELKVASVPLHFEETQAKVPDGPYGPMIFEAAKRSNRLLEDEEIAALARATDAS